MDETNFANQFIYSDFMDQVISYRLKKTMEDTIRDIKDYEGRKTLKRFQREDLNMWRKDIECMIRVYKYYAGDDDFVEEVEAFIEEYNSMEREDYTKAGDET
jgi:capsid protein